MAVQTEASLMGRAAAMAVHTAAYLWADAREDPVAGQQGRPHVGGPVSLSAAIIKCSVCSGFGRMLTLRQAKHAALGCGATAGQHSLGTWP